MSHNPSETLLLFNSAVPVSLTGTLTRTSLRSFTLKGGTMGLNDALEFWTLWSYTNNANVKTPHIAFGATNIITATVTTTDSMCRPQFVWNRASLSSQAFYSASQGTGTGNTSGALGTMSENTANDILIDFLGTLANIADTITLESCLVKLHRYFP